jgi:plasmid replication initiation protein
MLDVEITHADWVFDAIENNNVLTLNRQYFFLRKPLERRIYEIARKHCGAQPVWKIGLELLRDKCGSSSTVKEFRRLLGKIIDDDGQHNHMTDYTFSIEEDVAIVRPKKETYQSALPGDKTVLMIAHRLSTVKQCDRIIVLDKGQVVGCDTWAVLMAQNKAFQKIASVSEDS